MVEFKNVQSKRLRPLSVIKKNKKLINFLTRRHTTSHLAVTGNNILHINEIS